MDNFGCVFCHQQEKYDCPNDKEVQFFWCSDCSQRLLGMSQEQLRQGYDLAVKKGYLEKANSLEKIIEEVRYVRKTKKARPNLVRERIVRKAQSARH